MANSYKGKIEAIEGIQFIQRVGKEPFEKRRVMLDATRFDGLTGERGYEKHIIFDFSGKNAHVPDAFKVGDIVEISFDVESYEATKKDGTKDWFTSVRGYRIQQVTPQSALSQGGNAVNAFQSQGQAYVQGNNPQQYPPIPNTPIGQSSDAPF